METIAIAAIALTGLFFIVFPLRCCWLNKGENIDKDEMPCT